jgi:hypothetical protein
MPSIQSDRIGGVSLRLGTRGLYSWTIDLDIKDGQAWPDVVKQLAQIDILLKSTFPNHVKRGTGSYQPMTDKEEE